MAADGGLMLGVAALAGGVVAGGVAWWLGQRQIREAGERVAHLEQARHQAVQHTTMARRQIEQLQKELGELRHLLARTGTPVPPPRVLPVDPALPAAPEPDEAAGFQPTQLIQR